MRAPISMKTACITNGTRNGFSGIDSTAKPASGGNIAKPRVPKASCLPTSPRPREVSRVAITHAALSNASAAVGQMSARILEMRKQYYIRPSKKKGSDTTELTQTTFIDRRNTD